MSLKMKKEVPVPISQEDTEDAIEDVVANSYVPIEALQEAGINAADISKLKDEGFATVGQLFQVSLKRLLQVKGVSEAKAEKILQAGRKVGACASEFTTASALHAKCLTRIFITTGSKNLDEILGGGLESMSVTEVHGEFRSGKTQLCHTLCVTAQLSRSLGGGAGKVAYVDTEGTFRPQRVAQIAKERYNVEPDEILDNIIVARAYSHDAQMDLVMKLGMLFADESKGPFRLLVVDSVTALFRTDFSGRGELSERQQKLNQHLMSILKHAEEFNIAVLLVNQVMADPGANSMFGPVMKPVGGHVIAHAVHTRILLKKGREDTRICKLIDSPCMPEAEAVVKLFNGGVGDPDD